MNKQIENDLIKVMATLTCKLSDEVKEKIYKYIFAGIEIRNPDARIFKEEYICSSVEKEHKK